MWFELKIQTVLFMNSNGVEFELEKKIMSSFRLKLSFKLKIN
jgi:hypothetical protein